MLWLFISTSTLLLLGLDFEVELIVSNKDVVDLDLDSDCSFFQGWNHDRVDCYFLPTLE